MCNIELTDNNRNNYCKRVNYKICKRCYNNKKYDERKNNRENYLASRKLYRDNLRKKAFEFCGGAKCTCCGESTEKFLTIDHINNDGNLDRKNGLRSSDLYLAIINGKRDKSVLRVLCYNCNLTRNTIGECPHKIMSSKLTNCQMCDKILYHRDINKSNSNAINFHPLFLMSNIYYCYECVFKLKGNIIFTKQLIKNCMSRYNRRFRVINGYGGKCVCCGESNYLFLTIDHINFHDGLYDDKLYIYLIKNNYPEDNYRLLCYNCNCGRERAPNRICPHNQPQ